MNFLAHFYLAYGDEERLVGQFIADAVKGKQVHDYSDNIRDGILQHRLIDTMTDSHGAVSKLRAAIREDIGLLSSIAIDVYLDHALATQWSRFHGTPLKEFSQKCYSQLEKHKALLPERMQITLHYMKQYDWLSHYEQQEGIIRSLRGMSSRVRGGEKLLVAIDKFPLLIPSIHETFEQVFSDLTVAVKDHISGTNSSYLDSNHYY